MLPLVTSPQGLLVPKLGLPVLPLVTSRQAGGCYLRSFLMVLSVGLLYSLPKWFQWFR